MDGTIVGIFGIALADVIQMTIGLAIWFQMVVAVLAYRREKKLARKEDTLREFREIESELIPVRRRLSDA